MTLNTSSLVDEEVQPSEFSFAKAVGELTGFHPPIKRALVGHESGFVERHGESKEKAEVGFHVGELDTGRRAWQLFQFG